MDAETETPPVRLSVVVPVYQGERTLQAVVAELEPYTRPMVSPGGVSYLIEQVILVHDNGPDHSDAVMHALQSAYPFVSVIWLSRNFGQHAATLAGMAASTGQWIVTMDEDGQHDPRAIGRFLDTAIARRAGVVYAEFTNERPHGWWRSTASRSSKRMLGRIFGTPDSTQFQSFRLVRGDVGRQLAGFARSGVYLDVALSWVTNRVATAPVELRSDDGRISSYSFRSLLAYFWRMVLTSGTRALRLVSILGVVLAGLGLLLAIYLVIASVATSDDVVAPGWTSLMVVTLICTGAILVALGVIAEYIGVTLNVAMGRPLYLLVDDPSELVADPPEPGT